MTSLRPPGIGLLVMSVLAFAGLGLLAAALVSAPGPASATAATDFQLSSPAFPHGGVIPSAHTCDGANRAPALQWKGSPPGARSFALIMDDPDAPGGTFTHWVLFNIPATADRLPEGIQPRQAGISGRNDFGRLGYGGPCPPSGVHRYFFTLHAIDAASLSLPEGAGRRQVEQAMRGHALGQAQLMGRYGRR